MNRDATLEDLPFIMQQIVEGARQGHFNETLASLPEATKGFTREIASVITHRRRYNGLYGHAIAYEVGGKTIGFVVMSAGADNKGNELWLAGIRQDMRGIGHGKSMILDIVSHFTGGMLFSRLAPESEAMYHLLTNNGFDHVTTGEEGYRLLMYTR